MNSDSKNLQAKKSKKTLEDVVAVDAFFLGDVEGDRYILNSVFLIENANNIYSTQNCKALKGVHLERSKLYIHWD